MSEHGDEERCPGLSPHGRALLEFMREHPHAPLYRNRSGHRLQPHEVAAVRAAQQQVLHADIDWQPEQPPAWVTSLIEYCYTQVPFYRRYGAPPARFTDLPTSTRADLAREVAYLVPDDVPIERLICYRTSGTSGHPLMIASHPLVAAQYLAYHKRALRRFGVQLRYGRGQVGVVLIGCQASCFTYVSVTPTMDESGLAKLNLHPNDWREREDRRQYLEALQPELITGDPLSLGELLEVDPHVRPAALISTSMTLLPGLRDCLQRRFECPVLDVYSMNEAGPLAVFDARSGGHALLQPRMYVEILGPSGQPVQPGERGEVTLTGGFNFCLPLLRYRTGDHAVLARRGADLVLLQLEGRPPVSYRTGTGEWINNVEITHALRPLPLTQFRVHQDRQGSIVVQYSGAGVTASQVHTALTQLLGSDTPLRVERCVSFVDKVVQYTSTFQGAQEVVD
jgi:phenylacetate-CoA ligase